MRNLIPLCAFLLVTSLTTAQVGIGTTNPNSTLTVDGSVSTATVAIPFAITLDENFHTVFGSNITLPDPTNIVGREYIIKTDGDPAVITAASGDRIDESASISLGPWESVIIKAIGAGQWLVVGGKFDDQLGAEAINDLSDAITLNNSVYLGSFSGNTATGSRNAGLGEASLLSASGDNNVGLGSFAGVLLGAGDDNIFIGQQAGGAPITGITSGDNNIMIGKSVVASSQVVSNELNIGDAIYATNLYGATANVGIGNGNNAPNSTLSVNGSMSMPIRVGTANTPYTLTDTDFTYVTNGTSNNSADVTLPTAVGIAGRIYIIKSSGSRRQSLLAIGGQTIDGAANYNLNDSGRTTTVQSDGANWWVISTQ